MQQMYKQRKGFGDTNASMLAAARQGSSTGSQAALQYFRGGGAQLRAGPEAAHPCRL